MIEAVYFKVSDDLLNDVESVTDLLNDAVPKGYNKGYLTTNIIDIQVGLDKKDFVHNFHTVVIKYNIFKVPRIVKRLYK